MLTGKAKVDFETWYEKRNKRLFNECKWNIPVSEFFNNVDLSEQSGVYLEFFREQDLHICWDINYKGNDYKFTIWEYSKRGIWMNVYESFGGFNREFTQAIEKACEIYNERG